MNKKFFNYPYGYIENNGLISKKTQVENILEDVQSDYAENAELDAKQEEKIAANAELIQDEVERSTEQDSEFQDALTNEIAERKRMGGILNTKITNLETLVNDLNSGSNDFISNVEVKLNDEISRATESEMELSNKISEETKRATTVENSLKEMITLSSQATESINARLTQTESDFVDFKANGIVLNKIDSLEYELIVDGKSVGFIKIPQDNFLKEVKLENGSELVFTFITDTETVIRVDISEFIDTYTAGDGLYVDNNKFSLVIDSLSEPYLKLSANGLKLEGVDNAIAAAVSNEANLRNLADESIKAQISNANIAIETEAKNRENAVKAEENRAIGVEQSLENRIYRIEDYKLNESVESLKNNLSNEISRATEAENKIASDLSNEISRAITIEDELVDRLDKVENDKVDWISLGGNRKAITLKNHDIILGTDTKGSSYNIAMLSKWDIIDLGTTSLPINLNTPKDVRPTVQEAGQSGDAAHKIAYLEDIESINNSLSNNIEEVNKSLSNSIEEVKNSLPSLDGVATEEWVKEQNYLTEHQSLEHLATKEEIANVVSYTEGSNKKVILLENGDLIMGKVNKDSEIQPEPTADALTLLQLNKWNIVDLGSPKTILNINVHEGYRPTVQESNQSGEEAHKIAYLEDIESLKKLIVDLQARIKDLESKVYNSNQLVDALSKLKEGETKDIILYSDITIDSIDKLSVPVNSTLNLDLNGQTLKFNASDIFLRVQNGATLNIGGGKFEGEGYVASVNQGGIINVSDGMYDTSVTCFQVNGGVLNVYDGQFKSYSEKYGSKYTLNHIDKNKYVGKINVYGGVFVNYDPSNSPSENPVMNFVADGYGVVEMIEGSETLYKVVKSTEVASSQDFVNLFNSLTSEDKVHIKLSEDVVIDSDDVIRLNGDVTVDLNGKTLTHNKVGDILFRVDNGGTLNISNGNVITKGYVASANEGSAINVNGGTYNSNITCFQSNGGALNIIDGYFSACNDTYGCKYTINFIDSMKEVGSIKVSGGKFVGFDPSSSNSENPKVNFVTEGYKVVEKVENDLTIYEVVKE